MNRSLGRRALLPIATVLAAATLGGCVIDDGRRGYRGSGYRAPDYREGHDQGPPRSYGDRDDQQRIRQDRR
jgi:hypothetical protein